LFRANDWVLQFFPNYGVKRAAVPETQSGRRGIKEAIEFLFNNKMGDRLDDHLEKLTAGRWAVKEERHKLNMKGNRMGLRTGKHFSKPNPVFFQEKLLNRYQNNLNKWEEKWASVIVQEPSPFFLKEII
jgi:hypothetical protein